MTEIFNNKLHIYAYSSKDNMFTSIMFILYFSVLFPVKGFRRCLNVLGVS